MIDGGFIIRASQRLFLDSEAVLARMSKAKRWALGRNAGLVRTIARRLIRPATKKAPASQPGQPPKSHAGQLRQFLNFSVDLDTETAVIGPEAMNWLHIEEGSLQTSDTIPAILEYGGSYRVFEERRQMGQFYSTDWWRVDLRRRNAKAWLHWTDSRTGRTFVTDDHGQQRETRLRTVRIAARPYMGPALKTAEPKLVDMWRDAMAKAA